MTLRKTAVALAVFAMACGGGGERESAPAAVRPATPVERTTPPVPTLSAPSDAGPLRLIDAGSEPRRAMRYRPVDKSRVRLEQNVDVDILTRADGFKMIDTTTTSRVVLTGVYSSRGADGFSLSFKSTARSGGAAFAGGEVTFEGVVDFDARGKPGGSVDDGGTGIADGVRLMRLPKEPVGVGARWTQVDTQLRGGITISITTTFTLVRARGDELEVTHTSVTKTALQRALIPTPDQTLVFELISSKSSGEGRSVLSLTQPLAAGLTTMSFEGAMRMRTRELSAALKMQLSQLMKIRSRVEPGA